LISLPAGTMRMFAFKQFPFLTDGELSLIHDGFLDGDSAMERVPAYIFKIIRNQDKMPVGDIDIRIGLTAGLQQYGGQLGYGILPYCRGHYYAAKACLIIQSVALAHDMDQLWITCNDDNIASRKTCQYIGADYVDTVPVPTSHDLYLRGDRWKCRYLWQLNNGPFDAH
jgi:predicted acetyltransferase